VNVRIFNLILVVVGHYTQRSRGMLSWQFLSDRERNCHGADHLTEVNIFDLKELPCSMHRVLYAVPSFTCFVNQPKTGLYAAAKNKKTGLIKTSAVNKHLV
jgi:hypothetical protein